MTNKRLFLLLFIIFSTISYSEGQHNGIDLLGAKSKVEIPFNYINGFIIVEVMYGGILSMNFIVDTGASHNILFKKRANDLLGYAYSDTILIGGADLDVNTKALVSRGIPFKLKGTKIIQRDIVVLQEDVLDLEHMMGIRVDGILGGDFLKGLVVDIDFKNEKLTLLNPNSFVPNSDFSTHKITIKNYKPYLVAITKIDDSADSLSFLLDTGASLALLIHANKENDINLPKHTILGNIGQGISGELIGYIGMVNNLKFKEYEFKNVISSFQEIDSVVLLNKSIIRDGIIGNLILSRFHVQIDYMRSILYLDPIKNLKEKFKFDKSGMLVYAFGSKLNQYFVKTVYPNTPASEADIRPGDRIIKIGFWPMRFYSLYDIINKLQGKEGEKIKITVLRNDTELKKEFRLRNFFK